MRVSNSHHMPHPAQSQFYHRNLYLNVRNEGNSEISPYPSAQDALLEPPCHLGLLINKDLSNKTSSSTVQMVPKFVYTIQAPRLIISGAGRQRFDVVLFYKGINLHLDEIIYLIQVPRTRLDFENAMQTLQDWISQCKLVGLL